ncbi:MAG: hypothetical protein AAF514_18395, partial [Verrucomicrobiota bacterium]
MRESRLLTGALALGILWSPGVRGSDLTEYEQYFLELINRACSDPQGEVERSVTKAAAQPGIFGQQFGINNYHSFTGAPGVSEGPPSIAGNPYPLASEPRQPLVINPLIQEATRAYVRTLQTENSISHTLDGQSPEERIAASGYPLATPLANALNVGNLYYLPGNENNGFAGFSQSWDWNGYNGDIRKEALDTIHHNFFVDSQIPNRGHRITLLTSSWSEAGIALDWGRDGAFHSVYTVNHFGFEANARAFITGVVFRDSDNDQFYTPESGSNMIFGQAKDEEKKILKHEVALCGRGGTWRDRCATGPARAPRT